MRKYSTVSEFLRFSTLNWCHRYTGVKTADICCFITTVLSGRSGI